MNKLLTSFVVAALWFSYAATSCVATDVELNAGILDLEGTFGTGENTSFVVIDFGGGPETSPGPRDSYAFAFQYDDPDTTAATALQGIVADGSGLEIDFGGSPDDPFGLFLNAITFGEDSDAPVFSVDERFWQFFTGTVNDGEVQFEASGVGISSVPLIDGAPQEPLFDGSFIGFRAQTFNAAFPAVPVTAVPEPGCLLVLTATSVGLATKRRRR